MAARAADVTLAQDGGGARLHPYLLTLVRWCVSCLWSTATVFLHRLMITPLQPITGPKPAPPRPRIPKRAAGTEHLHPEPRVECQLLHQPHTHTMDVIFVHGLYGSLGNTWRQGDWRLKYVTDPSIVTLRDHSERDSCRCLQTSSSGDSTRDKDRTKSYKRSENKYSGSEVTDSNESDISINKINEKLSKKIIPQENDLITEQFYNNTLVDQDKVSNYDTRGNFVSDMFKKETGCDRPCANETFKHDNFNCDPEHSNDNNDKKRNIEDNINNRDEKCDRVDDPDLKCDQTSEKDFECKFNEMNEFNECICSKEEKSCEVGCGCICNECYSSCWPRDWVREDFPGARIISINYTSDPYLWRPLWIKENKRLNLYQRAEQMIEQLLEMGVGQKPIIWVGHSKGGLFIKQIYCQAYEAYKKTNKNFTSHETTREVGSKRDDLTKEPNEMTADNIDTIIGHFTHDKDENKNQTRIKDNFSTPRENITRINNNKAKIGENKINNRNMSSNDNMIKICDLNAVKSNDNKHKIDENKTINTRLNYNYTKSIENIMNNNASVMNEIVEYENIYENLSANDNLESINVVNDNINSYNMVEGARTNDGIENVDLENGGNRDPTSNTQDDSAAARAGLYTSSRGFMFYSVPHRGSPLADIKTPLTARSVDLLEIAKDCPLVLELQARWRRATADSRVRVRSVVETSRTLMSVLWLRIVSTDSADAGVGMLSGVSVDHREICKPSSRRCELYTMLTDLIHQSLNCSCE